MNNPWTFLPKEAPYFLDIDRKWVEQYQNRITHRSLRKRTTTEQTEFLKQYNLDLNNWIPFPYYGNPNSARVVVLQANPGVDTQLDIHPFRELVLHNDRKNLTHELELPIYSLAPEYRHWEYRNGEKGHCWYWQRTKEFQEILGWKLVAKSFFFMELFPYRSIRLFYPETLPPSEEYSFYLLRLQMKKEIPVIVTRMKKKWFEYIPELRKYPYLYTLKSSQCAYLTKNNLGEIPFHTIVSMIKKG